MGFFKKYYFLTTSIIYIFLVLIMNLLVINETFLIYLLAVLFCFVIRVNKSYGIITSNTIFAWIVLQMFVPVSVFFDANFKTLTPNWTAHIEIDADLLRGLDKEIFISTDEQGFRSLHSKGVYERKLYLVGGSTTEQLAISDGKTTASILEELLINAGHAVNVVNTGVSGLRAVHHASTIRNIQGADAVGYIILVGVNDWNNLIRTGGSDLSIGFLSPNNWLLTKAVKTLKDIVVEKYGLGITAREIDPNAYYQAVMNSYQDKPKVNFKVGQNQKNNYSTEVQNIEDACEGVPNAQFCVFVSQPHGYYTSNFEDGEYVKSLWMTPPNTDWALSPESLIGIANEFNDLLEDSVDCRDCYVLRLDEVFGGNTTYLYDDVHFNNEGARLFAESVFAFLSDNKLLDF